MSLPGRESLSSIRELARRQTYFPSRVDYTGLPGLKREKERAKSTSDSLPRRAGGERTAPPASSRPAAIWRARRPLPPPVSAALRERSPPRGRLLRGLREAATPSVLLQPYDGLPELFLAGEAGGRLPPPELPAVAECRGGEASTEAEDAEGPEGPAFTRHPFRRLFSQTCLFFLE